jgi:hypothetical protein
MAASSRFESFMMITSLERTKTVADRRGRRKKGAEVTAASTNSTSAGGKLLLLRRNNLIKDIEAYFAANLPFL